ncbi:hypothetical protein LUZ60_014737 [Juncus effusus]|nr:hypothetical protein LUZ60_014737 [Juncus effusus]
MANLECRMYESEYPDVDTAVMIKVKQVTDMGAYVFLLEYNNMEGMILLSELSRRRIRSVHALIKPGSQEPAIVLRVVREKGYIDLSKRRVSEEDAKVCEERYNKSKLVHSILRHVAETLSIDLIELYTFIAWPLSRQYGHAYEAFKLIVSDPDSIIDSLTREVKETDPNGTEVVKVVPAVSEAVKAELLKNIRRRLTRQCIKIRADVQVTCRQFDGVLHIKKAMRKAELVGTDDCPVKIKLVAAPLYVLTTQTLDKNEGIAVLNNAIKACAEEIETYNGTLLVKESARAVSEHEDKLLTNDQEVDDDSEEEEDTGMGGLDSSIAD